MRGNYGLFSTLIGDFLKARQDETRKRISKELNEGRSSRRSEDIRDRFRAKTIWAEDKPYKIDNSRSQRRMAKQQKRARAQTGDMPKVEVKRLERAMRREAKKDV